MKKLTFPLLSLAFVAISANMNAQDAISDSHNITITIPTVAILDIEPSASKNISMAFTEPTEAGLPIQASTNNSLWLNYSSIKTTLIATRHISVKVETLIPGVDIKVTAAAPTGGAGTLGTSSAAVTPLTLTGLDQSIISGIGSAYTGSGASGSNLTYALVPGNGTSYSDLIATTTATAKVIYTFIDN